MVPAPTARPARRTSSPTPISSSASGAAELGALVEQEVRRRGLGALESGRERQSGDARAGDDERLVH